MWKLIFSSVIATGITVAFGLWLATLIPVEIAHEGTSSSQTASSESRPYTMDELRQATEQMKQRLEQQRIEDSKKPKLQIYREARRAGAWFTWLPWIVLPLILRIKSYKHVAIVLAIPLLVMLSQVILYVEFLLSGAALLVSVYVVGRFRDARREEIENGQGE